MRTKGSPDELEHRRQLAVQRSLEGFSTDEIAEFLGIPPDGLAMARLVL